MDIEPIVLKQQGPVDLRSILCALGLSVLMLGFVMMDYRTDRGILGLICENKILYILFKVFFMFGAVYLAYSSLFLWRRRKSEQALLLLNKLLGQELICFSLTLTGVSPHALLPQVQAIYHQVMLDCPQPPAAPPASALASQSTPDLPAGTQAALACVPAFLSFAPVPPASGQPAAGGRVFQKPVHARGIYFHILLISSRNMSTTPEITKFI